MLLTRRHSGFREGESSGSFVGNAQLSTTTRCDDM
jgi:hypothetical protein